MLYAGESATIKAGAQSIKVYAPTSKLGGGLLVETLPEQPAEQPAEDRSVVRIRVPDWVGRLYAYKLDSMGAGVRVGDWVRVKLPSGKPHYAKIVAFGRDGHDGPLKPAELVD